mmetsp:Transcript_45439/g.142420  ORF Transcript_45439/g.142420 Transcript_45439/m.142420 type:complete len:225 (-) Transcript_45439:1090-1764(-)
MTISESQQHDTRPAPAWDLKDGGRRGVSRAVVRRRPGLTGRRGDLLGEVTPVAHAVLAGATCTGDSPLERCAGLERLADLDEAPESRAILLRPPRGVVLLEQPHPEVVLPAQLREHRQLRPDHKVDEPLLRAGEASRIHRGRAEAERRHRQPPLRLQVALQQELVGDEDGPALMLLQRSCRMRYVSAFDHKVQELGADVQRLAWKWGFPRNLILREHVREGSLD